MQRTNKVVGMLRVTMIGVALSAAPIFNSVHAQQAHNQTSLLLEVQNLRQEIAQLRDMVERQQFQMRKLQGQLAKQAPVNGSGPNGQYAQQGYNTTAINSSSSNYPADSVASAQTNPNWQGSAANPQFQPVSRDADNIQGSYSQSSSSQNNGAQTQYSNGPDVVIDQAANGTYSNSSNSRGVEERVITAPPVDRSQSDSDYPPVVDRSIGQSAQNVPITGQGSNASTDRSIPANSPRVTDNPITAESAGSRVFSQDLPVSERLPESQGYRNQAGGVISVPGPQAQGAGNGAIAANQIPVNPSAQVANIEPTTQAATSGAEAANNSAAAANNSVAGGLSEVEFYNQGFELLKQSKYEEASTVFEQQIAAYPSGDRADDAHYWISEAMHVSRKLDVAKVHLRTIIKDFPQSNRLPDAMLKTAYIEQSQGNQIEARILFQEIVNYHPKSDAAIAAKNQLAGSN